VEEVPGLALFLANRGEGGVAVVEPKKLPLQGLGLLPAKVEPGAPKVQKGREVLGQDIGLFLRAELQKPLRVEEDP
jgi:hypothetical protein